MSVLILICVMLVIAALFALLELLECFIGEGYEDENGFHDGSEKDAD